MKVRRRTPGGGIPIDPIVLAVPGLHCGACRAEVESIVTSVRGVTDVHADLRARTVTVHRDGTPGVEHAVRRALAARGYPAATDG